MIQRWAGVKESHTRSKHPPELHQTRNKPAEAPSVQSHGSTVLEPARRIPVLDSCEVLVVGGGPSGISAALAARRAGADTLIVERFDCLGGVITTVGMETIGWYKYEGAVESEGIGLEMERLAARMGGTNKWAYNESECLDAAFFQVVADGLISEAGVRCLFHSTAVETVVEDGQIRGVIIESKSGRQAILAERVIDCTGDADVAHLAGCSYHKLPRSEMLGVSTVFNASGVDKKRFLEYAAANPKKYADWATEWTPATTGKEDELLTPYLGSEFEKARQMGVISEDVELGGTWSSISDAGEATNLNLVYMKNYDATDVRDLTEASIRGRGEAMQALAALKAVVPGFEHAKLRNFAMTLGVRDSRKINGRYRLTEADVTSQAEFDDSIGIFPEFLDGYNVLVLPSTGRYFQVPYGSLVPDRVDNLLVAGRAVSGDRISHTAMRNMMACTVTGQGAGAAAAVSLRTGATTATVDVKS
ncbi:MAG TPA: FAD-dependent oxidoreductase, partial [Sediminispirochaeta sp.]|nr:FAD-dependent oxidoreductase [Sediminispirochaeta sp.]